MAAKAADEPSVDLAQNWASAAIDLQFQGASYFATGAITILGILIGIFSVLLSIVVARSGIASTPALWTSVGLIFGSAILLAISWAECNITPPLNPISTTTDLVVKQVPMEQVKREALLGTIQTYGANKVSLAWAARLLLVSIPIAAAGLGLFIYAGTV